MDSHIFRRKWIPTNCSLLHTHNGPHMPTINIFIPSNTNISINSNKLPTYIWGAEWKDNYRIELRKKKWRSRDPWILYLSWNQEICYCPSLRRTQVKLNVHPCFGCVYVCLVLAIWGFLFVCGVFLFRFLYLYVCLFQDRISLFSPDCSGNILCWLD